MNGAAPPSLNAEPRPGGCGSCTLCCTVMKVTAETVKPAHVRCEHCESHGCAIYDERPLVCREFKCLWLASQQTPELSLGQALRPDRARVVLDINTAGYIIAHCERPLSWMRQPIHNWLLLMATRTKVMLETPNGAYLLSPDGSTERLQKVGVDPLTNQRLYMRSSEIRGAALERTRP